MTRTCYNMTISQVRYKVYSIINDKKSMSNFLNYKSSKPILNTLGMYCDAMGCDLVRLYAARWMKIYGIVLYLIWKNKVAPLLNMEGNRLYRNIFQLFVL